LRHGTMIDTPGFLCKVCLLSCMGNTLRGANAHAVAVVRILEEGDSRSEQVKRSSRALREIFPTSCECWFCRVSARLGCLENRP
jgi:hypothetical protein